MLPRRNTESVPAVKIMLPIGALFDIPTGMFLEGVHGQYSLNGGVGVMNAIVGMGNNFKSTILHYWSYASASRVGKDSYIDTYDTETNIHLWHLTEMARSVETIGKDEDWITDGRHVVTDSSIVLGDKWFDEFKEHMLEKIKQKKKYSVETPFLDKIATKQNGKITPVMMIYPTHQEVDSASRFVTKDVVKMQDDNSLGDKGANTVYMRQGLQKSRFIDETLNLATGSSTYVFMTAHFGEKIEMDPNNPSAKQLQHVKQGQRIKGVPPNFMYLMNTCWHAMSSVALLASDNTIMYPRYSKDKLLKDQDLNLVTLKQLRSKSGPSGNTIGIVVSQKEGVLPNLTEFHYIKTNQYWGLDGGDRNYVCTLCPAIKLSRTRIRTQLDRYYPLRRAINILSEYLQMRTMWFGRLSQKYYMEPKELYEKIKEQGYDWDMILNYTRGWWTIDKDNPYLEISTYDILRMALGEYHPYWLESDKKTIKKAYAKGIESLPFIQVQGEKVVGAPPEDDEDD